MFKSLQSATPVLAVLLFAGSASAAAPTREVFYYNLAPGASTAPIYPPADVAIQVMGVQLNLGYRGVGQVSLLRIPNSFLEWTGLESTAGSAITQGFSGSSGTHIVYLDFSHSVDIQVHDGNSFVIHNGSTSVQMSGEVTLIW